ncbi:hypothetical protein [Terrabacter sp. MAHUQ-38]|uniref:hypothetical protein n=1 Tax=unclassified Terrabacter TaxID=2630222 RepID=UPI00165E0F9A|nr:hypothetical protein [Terrabacter sp. MAHUQ-38]MBC9821610.1 hypothetical protein [Terrabacter sp. MAHUQ-38]
MTVPDDAAPRGRLLLVTAGRGRARAGLAAALAARLERAVVVDGEALERAVLPETARRGWAEPPTPEQLRLRLLRWSAALAVAETYQLEGFDAVLSDDAHGEHLEDFLDLAAPEPVHVVVLGDPADRVTPRWGLWVGGTTSDEATADEVLARLDEALVPTSEGDGPG